MIRRIVNGLLLKFAGFAPGGYSVRPFLHRLRGVKMGARVWVSQQVYIDELHPEALTIGDDSSIGLRVSIFTHFYWGPRREQTNMGRVVIGRDVFIGPHCVILPGVTVGDGAVVKAGTVVSQDVPSNTLWGCANPTALARVTVPLTAAHSYQGFTRGLRPIRRRERDA